MAKETQWDAAQMPSLAGKTAIVTGANSGIGLVAARELARHGARVVLACRSAAKGVAAQRAIEEALAADAPVAGGSAVFMALDVSRLASVRAFAAAFRASHDRLDLLVNNAGVMAVPHALTEDGVESQFATNHLGHFALTAQLLDVLRRTADGGDVTRVVNVASLMHWFARMKLDRVVTPATHYRALEVYANTKLYNILFSKELDRRLRARGVTNVQAVACHPGYSNTNLVEAPSTKSNWFMRFWWGIFAKLSLGQPPEMGALPSLFAATSADLTGGEYVGPDGFLCVRGYPRVEKPRNGSDSLEAAARLWEESEKLAQLTFTIE